MTQDVSIRHHRRDLDSWHALPAHFKFRTLTDINRILSDLEQQFPLGDHMVIGIKELMVNAVEHGNLGIGYELKTKLLEEGRWLDEVNRRLTLKDNLDKTAQISFSYHRQTLLIEVADAGRGFDYELFMGGEVTDVTTLNGRGLLLAQNVAFDELQFLENGRRIHAIKYVMKNSM